MQRTDRSRKLLLLLVALTGLTSVGVATVARSSGGGKLKTVLKIQWGRCCVIRLGARVQARNCVSMSGGQAKK
jgi:hypothetical protein